MKPISNSRIWLDNQREAKVANALNFLFKVIALVFIALVIIDVIRNGAYDFFWFVVV